MTILTIKENVRNLLESRRESITFVVHGAPNQTQRMLQMLVNK